jgi:SAM-dependent methyltransferase
MVSPITQFTAQCCSTRIGLVNVFGGWKLVAEAIETPELDYSGERMVPERADASTYWEHVYRYHFATKWATGRHVLDIACGEGYGSAALLRAGAASVIGVDISEEACKHASMKYGIDARLGSAEAIPLADHSVDLLVSFETIEHLDSPGAFVNECARVLRPGGRLIISTPNRDVYSPEGTTNPFHTTEMSADEFSGLLARRFTDCRLFGQQFQEPPFLCPQAIGADETPWMRLRGFFRLRESLRRWVCPHMREGDPAGYRRSTSELIISPVLDRGSLFHPYAVWPYRSWARHHATYIIAVATV